MKLLRETLVNFKGIRSYTFSPQGESVSVSGDNGSGKTSLLDGFCWVLFDRYSAGHCDFELKTLDEAGAPIPMLEHSVEIEIEHQGRRRQLKKTLSENWVKARGAATAEFSGHRIAYEIDQTPLAQKDYDAVIATFGEETLLRLLTDPLYFVAKLPWQQRRRILLELCGDISEAELVAGDARLAELPALLAGRSIEDYRKTSGGAQAAAQWRTEDDSGAGGRGDAGDADGRSRVRTRPGDRCRAGRAAANAANGQRTGILNNKNQRRGGIIL